MSDYKVKLPRPHEKQKAIRRSKAKRRIVRAGRRGGKTVVASIITVDAFLAGRRVLYATPTTDQLYRWWYQVTNALGELINHGVYRKQENIHAIEKQGTEQRLRGKTAWNHDTLRGDYADLLILDEYQLMNEDAWQLVGAPMLLDNNGDALFIYTPPSLHSRSVSKANDPQHAAKMFKQAQNDTTGRWEAFHFTSHDNPYISQTALQEITQDMTGLAYKMEIMAEDINEAPGALWTRDIIERNRTITVPPEYEYIVVAVDPSITSGGDAAGIVTVGRYQGNYYVISDDTIQGSPLVWARTAVTTYHKYRANLIVAEANQGGEMVSQTIHTVDESVPVDLVHASRGKQTRAEPIASLYEQNKVHHIGNYLALEDEMCIWVPGDPSPNRMDALVWGMSKLHLAQITLGVI